MPGKKPFDLARAWGLYWEAGWTLDEVAAALGVGRTTLWRRFEEARLYCRPRGTRTRRQPDQTEACANSSRTVREQFANSSRTVRRGKAAA